MWTPSRQALGQNISWNRTVSEPFFHKYTNTLSSGGIFIISFWLYLEHKPPCIKVSVVWREFLQSFDDIVNNLHSSLGWQEVFVPIYVLVVVQFLGEFFSKILSQQRQTWNRTISEPYFHEYTIHKHPIRQRHLYYKLLTVSGAQASLNKSLCSLEGVSPKLWWHCQQSAWLSGLARGLCSHRCPCGRTVPWGGFSKTRSQRCQTPLRSHCGTTGLQTPKRQTGNEVKHVWK